MEECLRVCMRKLALWHTRTFKPIMTHDELDPIMATLGFVALAPSPSPIGVGGGSATVWKAYAYCGGGRSAAELLMPSPRLPYPRIDGLHIYTYQAFIDALNFYLDMTDISVLFHIRGMPLHCVHDKNKKLRRMEEDDSVFVYREGTLDEPAYNLYRLHNSFNGTSSITTAEVAISNGYYKSVLIRNKGDNTTVGCVVPLKNIMI
ncbi:uncharacterized protein LOC131155462 [Malania oleifera]|uniref:uncharacterized protein LOC131155462 n=1 Tax=Malania oleifera TaxID=397392 RepID=UPI0025ADCD40|nr:uncharacterized protein LOC131155462 [Malania oleifera]